MKKKIFQIINSVDCYHGYKRNERPISFVYQNKRREIIDIIDRWYEGNIQANRPVKNYFKVRTKDEKIFILCYSSAFHSWSVQVKKYDDIDERERRV
jgi:hypothetical protein